MSRPLRLELAGGLYHVTSRGDGREDIFLSDSDRLAWLVVFGQVCKRFNWVCHAWCQMTNHYHVLVETPEANLAQGMRQLNGVYTQRFNRAHARVGHVFQGRYKAILVERDSYLLELSRYVVLNPLRAGMVKRLEDWSWSSYGASCGQTAAPEWLQTYKWGQTPFSSLAAESHLIRLRNTPSQPHPELSQPIRIGAISPQSNIHTRLVFQQNRQVDEPGQDDVLPVNTRGLPFTGQHFQLTGLADAQAARNVFTASPDPVSVGKE